MSELVDEIVSIRKEIRDVKRQLGELPKVTGVQTIRENTAKIIVKRVQVNVRNIAGNTLIWGHPTLGIWGEYKWGSTLDSSFILGHPSAGVLGTSKLGSNTSAWEEFYDSGDLE